MTVFYWQDPDSGDTEVLEFDIITALTPEDPVAITEHPVEVGANVTDHARDENERLTVEALTSTVPNLKDADVELSPLDLVVHVRTTPTKKTIPLDIPKPPIQPSLEGAFNAATGAIGDALFGGPKATVLDDTRSRTQPMTASAYQQSSPRNRVRDIYEKLLGAKTKHALVTVQTTMRDYFDMLIERIAAPQTVDDGNAVRFQLDLKRIRVADSETVQSPQPAEARGTRNRNRGAQNPKDDPNAAQKVEVESTMYQGITALGG